MQSASFLIQLGAYFTERLKQTVAKDIFCSMRAFRVLWSQAVKQKNACSVERRGQAARKPTRLGPLNERRAK